MACRCFRGVEADGASFQFLKPLLVKARLSLRSILLDFSADTHTAKFNVIWVVGLVMQPGPHGKQNAWHALFTTVLRTDLRTNNQSNLSGIK